MTMRSSIWALVLIFGPCFVYSQVVVPVAVTTDSGTIQTITENGLEKKVMRVDSGASISLVCTLPDDDVTGMAGIAIWAGPKTVLYFDETPAHRNPKFSLEKKTVGSTTQYIITMNNLSFEEEGLYKCQDLNENEFPLWIMVSTAPNITSITPMQTAVVGDAVKLECIADGSPEPQIRWKHTRPNQVLPNGIEGKYKIGINLDIDSITLSDRGEYKCIASNGIPNDKHKPFKTTFIKMEYEPVVSALTEDNPEKKVPLGESTELRCKAEAHPRPSPSDVSWFLDDVAISDMDGYTVENNHQIPEEKPDPYDETTFSTLRIIEVNTNTTGDYKCQFKNSKGTNSASIALQIGEPPVYTTTKTIPTVAYITNKPETGQSQDGNDDGGDANVLSMSLVTILSMMSLVFTLIH